MFETTPPLSQTWIARIASPSGYDGEQLDPATSGEELRMFDWSELTARLNAARDLRLLLRRDSGRSIGASAHDFADAAARYFRKKEEGQSNVNPVALEHRKCSPGMIQELDGLDEKTTKFRKLPKNSDARED